MKDIITYITEATSKWYLRADEFVEALDSTPSKGKKPVKFVFNNIYELYPDYDVHEWGVTDQFKWSDRIWYMTLVSENKFPKMPAYELVDFKGESPKDVVCVGDKWTPKNGSGKYNASNKKFRIIDVKEEEDFIVININNSK